MKKNFGSFYTPSALADWLAGYVQPEFKNKKQINVLEPSCGDGEFLRALNLIKKPERLNVVAVDIDEDAIKTARKGKYKFKSRIYHQDFLSWNSATRFDLVVGNPPYVIKKRLPKSQASACRSIHKDFGLVDREVANLWTAFVVKSVSMLANDGIAAFVLPTEILQVKYAEEIRAFLMERFKRIEFISFKHLAFSNIEQDTVILICYSSPQKSEGVYFSEVSSIDELSDNVDYSSLSNPANKKWTGSILCDAELEMIYDLDARSKKITDHCQAVAGIVTAANSYFILRSDIVERFGLEKFAKPIIQRGLHVNGSVEFSEEDFELLKSSNTPCWLLDLNNISEKDFPDELSNYLSDGEALQIHSRYKCKLRNRWYDIPSIWKSEGFFFKRCHHYPKMLINSADVHVTDSAYRIRMTNGYKMEGLAFSFYNSFTLAMAELSGRYYGGGVLELTPNEFKGLPVFYSDISKRESKAFIEKFENKGTIDNLLDQNDQALLAESAGLSQSNIKEINAIYKKLRTRRMREQL
jgi:adenine-specific DNA-methyltransferase